MVGEQFLNVGYVVSTLLSALVAWIAIMISNKVIAHNVDAKRGLVMSIIALFIVPIIGAFIALPIPFFGAYILPLIVWIILGEVLLRGEGATTKLKVVIVAFVVYILLSIFVAPYIWTALPF